MTGQRKPRKALWIGVFVALLILAAVFWRMRGANFEWGLFLNTFQGLNWWWMSVSVACNLFSYVGRALRWEVMLRPLGKTLSIRKLTYDTVIGLSAVVLLGRPGEVVRPYLIATSAGLPFSSQMAAWILERILDLLAVVLLFGLALARMPSQGLALSPGLRWVLETGGYLMAAIGAASVLFLILFRNFARPVQGRILSALTFLPPRYYQKIDHILTAFCTGMDATRDFGNLMRLIVYTVLEWATILISYYTFFLSFPVTWHFSITDVVVFLGFLCFGSLVQIPGVGGGIQVTTVIVLTQILKVSLESAAGLALFLWIATYVVVVPAAAICAFLQGMSWGKLKQNLKEAAEEPAL